MGWRGGRWVRNDTQAMGFDRTFLAGYSNSHMGYFATPDEYDIGGTRFHQSLDVCRSVRWL